MSGIYVARLSVFCTAVILLASCSSLRTHYDYETGVDFSGYKSYVLAADKSMSQTGAAGAVSPLNQRRIGTAIQDTLQAAGYMQADTIEAADMIVAYSVGSREKVDYDTYVTTHRGVWSHHWPYYEDIVRVHSYREGSLAIDIFDRASNRPIWHGIAKKRITGWDEGDVTAQINSAVGTILGRFPPP